jgi:YesN/AraC family two-component response regulator
MPGGMAGTDLALVARKMRPEIKTLLTSGFAEASIREQPRFKEIGDILSKPYRRQDLARKLLEIVGHK